MNYPHVAVFYYRKNEIVLKSSHQEKNSAKEYSNHEKNSFYISLFLEKSQETKATTKKCSKNSTPKKIKTTIR